MKQTNERLCALAQKGDAAALDSLIDNNKSFIGKVANDLFRSMNLAQAGLNLDTDDLKQAGNLGLWKAVPKFDAARGMKFLTYAAPAIRNAMMDMVRDAFTAFEQRMVTEDKDGICYQRVSLDDVLPGEEQLRRIEAIADPYAMQPQIIMEEQESRRELYDGLKQLTQREQTYLLYRYGFTDGEEHPLIGTAIYFHLTKGRAKKTEDKDGICYQRVSLDDVLPGEEQLRRIEAIADPYAMQPQSIMEEQESRRELYDGLKRLTQREQTYLLYRYGFTDGEEHPLIGTAIYFHLTKGRAKKTEEQAMDNLWLELPWWFT
ncbi:MAG TPA: sigma-70 family RNA polymerase sigma factor [Faecalibacterium prausnitzii]|nr:sigma-70 family RNA polymerase sigma factor [Faecalibacterium prausnitzii]